MAVRLLPNNMAAPPVPRRLYALDFTSKALDDKSLGVRRCWWTFTGGFPDVAGL